MASRPDRRSPEAAAYRKLYKTSRWQKIRKAQLSAHPLCAMCKAAGHITPATICDHTTPHRGDPAAFYAGPFTSLCKPHHDGAKQKQEHRGQPIGCDADGWPNARQSP